jgi:uncharacterized protein (DUF302 family)
MKAFILFLVGLVIGGIGMGAVVWTQAPSAMLHERPSPHTMEATMTKITDLAKAEGWAVQSIIKLEESIKKNGGGDVLPIRLINLCQAKHAAKMMSKDDLRKLSVFMPCTISVYPKQDGKTYVASMNAALLGKLWGGLVAEVMGQEVAEAQEKFVDAATAE